MSTPSIIPAEKARELRELAPITYWGRHNITNAAEDLAYTVEVVSAERDRLLAALERVESPKG